MAKKKVVEDNKKWIVRNLVIYFAVVLVIVCGVSVMLSAVTNHNKVMEVPDFSNLTASEAARVASRAGLRTVVHDSLFQRGLRPGVVFEQNPPAGASVKKGRRIQLRINTVVAKKIPMPSLVGFTTRQARAELVRNGLVLGKLVYVRDIATNNVLKQMCRGKEIPAGSRITSGSTIDLVVGLSSTENMTFVPDLVGKDYRRAVDLLHDNSLNVGKLSFDSRARSYADTVRAVVISQNPAASSAPQTMGSVISLSLSSDPEKIAKARRK